MPYRVSRFERTPNPDALKCLVEPSPGPVPRSYFNADQAREANDELAVELFKVSGVTNILIHSAFITVSKKPETTWAVMKPAIKRALSKVA